MPKATKPKATAASVLRSNQAIETHYARHKACESIKAELDALDPQNFIDEETTALLVEKKKDHDKEAARFRQLAIEQENKSKCVQKDIDSMKEDGKKECNKAREMLLRQQTADEAFLLRAKSRLKETLNESLKETEYGDDPASDSDKEVEPDDSADARFTSFWDENGNPPRKPARRSTKTDTIEVEDQWVVQ